MVGVKNQQEVYLLVQPVERLVRDAVQYVSDFYRAVKLCRRPIQELGNKPVPRLPHTHLPNHIAFTVHVQPFRSETCRSSTSMPIPSSSRAGELSSSFTVVSDMKDESGGRAGTFMKTLEKRIQTCNRPDEGIVTIQNVVQCTNS